jgi:menaquinone-dependent protoporphyrinogen oxidase
VEVLAMTVLVVVASRHGGTLGIAEAVAAGLCDAGVPADLVRLTDAGLHADTDPDPGGYEAVVLGSAVYGAHWLVEAARWADDHADALRTRPVWLFSSGPVAPGLVPDSAAERDAVLVEGLTADLGARGHRLFGGRLERASLTPQELAVVTAFRVADVDSRDLPAARRWAEAIAAELVRRRERPRETPVAVTRATTTG